VHSLRAADGRLQDD